VIFLTQLSRRWFRERRFPFPTGYDLLLHEVSPGAYLTDPDVHGEVGKTYSLQIILEDGRQFSATEELFRVLILIP